MGTFAQDAFGGIAIPTKNLITSGKALAFQIGVEIGTGPVLAQAFAFFVSVVF